MVAPLPSKKERSYIYKDFMSSTKTITCLSENRNLSELFSKLLSLLSILKEVLSSLEFKTPKEKSKEFHFKMIAKKILPSFFKI